MTKDRFFVGLFCPAFRAELDHACVLPVFFKYSRLDDYHNKYICRYFSGAGRIPAGGLMKRSAGFKILKDGIIFFSLYGQRKNTGKPGRKRD